MRGVLGDNFKVSVRASGRDAFEAAMSLAFNGKNAKYWAETETWGLCYFWYMEKEAGMSTEHHHMELDREEYEYHSKAKDGEILYYRDSDSIFWTESYPIHSFGTALSVGPLLDRTWDWLNAPERVYPQPADHDGSNDKGFTIATQEGIWEGHIGSHHGGICFIRPDWMWIGK
jgi:hypothetical protein